VTVRVEHVAFDKPIRRACGHMERYQCRVTDPHLQERAIDRFQREQCGACRLGLELVRLTRLMPSVEQSQSVMHTPIEDLRLFVLGVKVLLDSDVVVGFQDGLYDLAAEFLK
jgi:hypothetical protein